MAKTPMRDEEADAGKIPAPRENHYLLGHDAAEKDYLAAWNSGRLAHAWLICGPRGIGKATLAYRMARYALSQGAGGNGGGLFGEDAPATSLAMSQDDPVFRRIAAQGHSDFRAIERPWADNKQTKRKTVITVDEVRGIGSFLSMTPAEGGWRAVVIDAADEMNSNAANAVLKVLEEPPRRALLFLVAHRPDKLLPTIRSRCRRLDLRSLKPEQVTALMNRYAIDLKPDEVSVLTALADGSIGRALELADEGGADLFREMIGLLAEAPKLSIARMHALSDKAMKGDAFRTLTGLLGWWLARMASLGARGNLEKTKDIVPGEGDVARRLLGAASPAAWAETWEAITHLAARTEAINLDKKRSLLSMLMTIERTAARNAA